MIRFATMLAVASLVAVGAFAFGPAPDDGVVRMDVEWTVATVVRGGEPDTLSIWLDGMSDHALVVDDSVRVNALRDSAHGFFFCSRESMQGREIEVNGTRLGAMGDNHFRCADAGLASDGEAVSMRIPVSIVKAWCKKANGGREC